MTTTPKLPFPERLDLVTTRAILRPHPELPAVAGETAEMAYCLLRTDDGRWQVAWHERGGPHDIRHYDDEHAACLALLAAVGLRP